MSDYLNSIKTDLKKLISFPSVEGAPEKDMPFGKGVHDALSFALSRAEELGFETKNYDNYIGEAVYGDGEEVLAVLVHLDVVPAGDEKAWKYPPFSGTETDGKIYGRGATDDKGPAITCLYALKALKDEGYIPKKKIKLIFGCNEESGSKCIKHYKEVGNFPDFGFSPDADFPVIYAEKGILHAEFSFDKPPLLADIKGGERINMVAEKAVADAPFDKITAEKYGVKEENGKICSYGLSAHGSTPEKGVNAILPLVKYLEETVGLTDKIRRFLFDDELKLKQIRDETGNLTMSPDIISVSDGKIKIAVDFRYPATYSGDELIKTLGKISDVKILSHQPPLYNDKDGFLVKTLLSVYNEETGENAEPIAIGGGTYARYLKTGAAFGPETDEDFSIHKPNEYVSVKNLEMQFKIYKKAIKKLSEV
ncbi:MAG TPA: dipeptidase PepV [Clostridiales bacterium]|nr:dipeptidase PepV [Clostridiales bacterium]